MIQAFNIQIKSSSRILPFVGIIYLYIVGICPDDKPELNCPFNLCDHQKCLNIPDTDCVFDVCGGCTARFYLGNEEVTDQCSMYNNYNSTNLIIAINILNYLTVFCRGSGQIFTSSGGTCPERTCENSGQVLCSAISIPGCDCPVGMVRKYTQKRDDFSKIFM